MGSTLPNAVWLPGSGEPIDWHITPTIMGAAADKAISGRSDEVRARRTYGAASALDASAIKSGAPVEVGDRILRTDLQQIEELKGTGWKLVQTLRGVSFTPDWASLSGQSAYGITPGNGQQAWTYHLAHDTITVSGVLVFGSTTTVGSSSIGILIPLVPGFPPRKAGGEFWCAGDVAAIIGGNTFRGALTGNADSVVSDEPYARIIFRGTPAQGNTKPMTNQFPGTWTQNSMLAVNYQYQTY